MESGKARKTEPEDRRVTMKRLNQALKCAASAFAFSCQSSFALAEEPNASCAETLKGLDWTLEERWEYFELDSDQAGAALLGVACRKEEVVSWFERHGWILASKSDYEPALRGPPGKEFRSDSGLRFCRPRNFVLRSLGAGCSATESIIFFEGRVTQVYAVASK